MLLSDAVIWQDGIIPNTASFLTEQKNNNGTKNSGEIFLKIASIFFGIWDITLHLMSVYVYKYQCTIPLFAYS